MFSGIGRARRQLEPGTEIVNRNDLAANVDDAFDCPRRARKGSNRDHTHNFADTLGWKAVALTFQLEEKNVHAGVSAINERGLCASVQLQCDTEQLAAASSSGGSYEADDS